VFSGLIASLNKIFRKPRVEGRESAEAYSNWEYRIGRDLVRDYLEPAGDLKGKRILDIGCGLGGKTVAYAEGGASEVYGLDVSADNVLASQRYAAGDAEFVVADAARLPVADGEFDTLIANDAMEHFAEPEDALHEMVRVTRRGGAIWLFFTPHFSPLGSHLYDYIYTPWCHLIFSRGDLERAIRRVLRSRNPEAGEAEIRLRAGEIMQSFDEDLNQMSIRRFYGIVRRVPGVRVSLREFRPAKYRFLRVLTALPVVRELFTGTVVCRLERIG